MCWERGLLLVTVSDEVELNTHWPTDISRVNICTRNGIDELWCMHFEERDQCGATMEGIEDSSRGRPDRKTRNEDEGTLINC